MSLDFSIEGLKKIKGRKDDKPKHLCGTRESKHHSTTLILDGNWIQGYEVDLDKLPKDIKKIQFRMY